MAVVPKKKKKGLKLKLHKIFTDKKMSPGISLK